MMKLFLVYSMLLIGAHGITVSRNKQLNPDKHTTIEAVETGEPDQYFQTEQDAKADHSPMWDIKHHKLNNTNLIEGNLQRLVAEVFDKTIVVCYKKTCDRHRPGGGAWTNPAAQKNVIIQDGESVDKRHAAVYEKYGGVGTAMRSMAMGSKGPPMVALKAAEAVEWGHTLKPLMSHLTAVETADELGLDNVLVLEADVVGSVNQPNEEEMNNMVINLNERLRSEQWDILRFSSHFNVNSFQHSVKSGTGIAAVETQCSEACTCNKQAWWSDHEKTTNRHICKVNSGARGAADREGTWCKGKDSSSYAVHKSSFKEFKDLKQAFEETKVPRDTVHNFMIDHWIPAHFNNLYVFPVMVGQQGYTGPEALPAENDKYAKMESAFTEHCLK